MNLKRAWLKPESLERASRNPRIADKRKTVSGKHLTGGTRPLRELREALGITQAEVAAVMGCRRTMIANLESLRYAAVIWFGIKMYLYFARIAAEKKLTALHQEISGEVRNFIAFQRNLNALTMRKAESELEEQRKAVEIREKRLADAEAQLREV